MKLKAPPEVRSAIKDVDLAKFGQLRREMLARTAEKKRLRALSDLREEQRASLDAAAAFVFEWRAAYADTEEARRICELMGAETPVVIFGARFWKGEPTDDRHCWATLSIADGPLLYQERYNSAMGSHASQKTLITGPAALVEAVHPEYLEKCRDHLDGPDAWKFILQELGRMARALK